MLLGPSGDAALPAAAATTPIPMAAPRDLSGTAHTPSEGPPAGLSRAEWNQIRRSIASSPNRQGFAHEAQLLGHPDPDPIGQSDAYFGWSVSVSGDTAVVGAPSENTAAGTDAG